MNTNTQKIDISIVIPVYSCAGCLDELYSRLILVLTSLVNDYEIIFIDDGSLDNAWQKIQQLTKTDNKIKGIRLSRNFGQHKAIMAGLNSVRGEWVIVMDCDLQDKPEEIPKLYASTNKSYDIIYARRAVRQDGWFRKVMSKYYYRIFDYLTGLESDEAIANFGIYSKNVIEHIIDLKEESSSFPLFVRWVGFSSTSVDVEHSERFCGKSSYSLKKLFLLAFDMIIAHSNIPLKISISIGSIMSFSSFLYSIYLMIQYLINSSPVEGWTSVMVSIYFLSGLILLTLGILGIYLGKVFNETKNRPQYIVKEKTWE